MLLVFYAPLLFAQSEGITPGLEELLKLSDQAQKNNLFDSALYYSNQAKDLLQTGSSTEMKANVIYSCAKANYHLNNFNAAENLYEEVILLAGQTRDYDLLAASHNDLGRLHKKNATYSEALRNFNLARQYYYSAGDSSGIALVSLNVGNVLKSVGNNSMAKQEYHKALSYFLAVNDEGNQAGCYNNLGNIYKNEKIYDSAFYYMYKTLSLRKRGSSKSGLAFIYHNLANLHLSLHNTDSALYYINQSYAINSSIPSAADMSFDFNVMGSIYIELKDWKKAIENLEKAKSLSPESGISENILDITRQLGYAYYQTGDTRKSAENFISFFEKSDSLQLINQASFIETELTRYTLFADSIKTRQLELERNLENVRRENTQLANSINFRNYLYAIIILLLVVAIVIIFFINARRRLAQTQAHEEVLQVQNEELKRTLISKEEKEILLKEVHHRVKNNLQIINSLIRLQSNFMNAKNFKEKLMETENRIRSMALIHEKLYKTGNLASLSVRNYIEELSFNIMESYDNHRVKIKLRFDIEEREYGIDTLIPLGLIINEVLSNSLKHAFYERTEGNIFISIHSRDNLSYMTIKDDGIGADLSFDELKEDSLGMELIDSLCDQLDGKLKLSTENGFEYQFEFRILK